MSHVYKPIEDIRDDGTLGELKEIMRGLPDGGQHPNRTLAFGPDDMLYISAGSTCNACDETNRESATMLRASPDGKSREIFASGLRNTIGFAWHPDTGELSERITALIGWATKCSRKNSITSSRADATAGPIYMATVR
ncbi:MAG: PQQ-dependent sugar dehydrogenase [Gammaproteobacteria bacterium]|nr:PQQ-dependent sugar dehydrogenase [Gammaproteobacteria bacterium]